MPIPLLLLLFGGTVASGVAGKVALDSFDEAVNSSIKLAVIGGAGFIAYKIVTK